MSFRRPAWLELLLIGFVAIASAGCGDDATAPNDSPRLTILDPESTLVAPRNSQITFSATATDTEDGDLSEDIIWVSDLAGELGTGGDIAVVLEPGVHNVTARVTDSQGETVTATTSLEVSQVEANGFTPEINALVPDSLIAAMEDLGMPIARGPDPPALEAAFLVSPFVLTASSVPGDSPGFRFPDYYVEYSRLDPDSLTLDIDWVNGPSRAEGIGGLIVGEDGRFSIFSTSTATLAGAVATILEVHTGTIGIDGLEDFHTAVFMLDNQGNPGGVFIPEATGRVGRDDDAFSPEIDGIPAAASTSISAGASARRVPALLSCDPRKLRSELARVE